MRRNTYIEIIEACLGCFFCESHVSTHKLPRDMAVELLQKLNEFHKHHKVNLSPADFNNIPYVNYDKSQVHYKDSCSFVREHRIHQILTPTDSFIKKILLFSNGVAFEDPVLNIVSYISNKDFYPEWLKEEFRVTLQNILKLEDLINEDICIPVDIYQSSNLKQEGFPEENTNSIVQLIDTDVDAAVEDLIGRGAYPKYFDKEEAALILLTSAEMLSKNSYLSPFFHDNTLLSCYKNAFSNTDAIINKDVINFKPNYICSNHLLDVTRLSNKDYVALRKDDDLINEWLIIVREAMRTANTINSDYENTYIVFKDLMKEQQMLWNIRSNTLTKKGIWKTLKDSTDSFIVGITGAVTASYISGDALTTGIAGAGSASLAAILLQLRHNRDSTMAAHFSAITHNAN